MTVTVPAPHAPTPSPVRKGCAIPIRLAAGVMAGLIAAAAPSAGAADINKGRQIYMMHCASCHGVTGMSVMPGAPNFARNENMFQPDIKLVNSIRSGKNMMPAYLGILTDRDMFDVVAYLRALR